CEYCVHIECHDFSVANCKECATYPSSRNLPSVTQFHHWREGNLPGNSKCHFCKKTCWSVECLSGIRCEWCGLTAHATCYKNLPVECNFGCLASIMLPPSCVSIPRTYVPLETIMGVQTKRRETMSPARSISEEISSSGDMKNKEFDDYPSPKEKDRVEELIKVYDGNSSMKRSAYRTISISQKATREQVIGAALRAFHIHDDPNNYYLIDVFDPNEKELGDFLPVQSLIRREGKRPAMLLRYRPPDPEKGSIRIYLGNLGIISWYMVNSVHERIMDNQECPWELLRNIARESIREMSLTRFYLQQKDESSNTTVALFIGNLPPNLSQRQYEKILINMLGKPYRFKQIGPIYYEYGSLIVSYDNADIAVKTFYMLRECSFDDKNLLVLLLPNITSEMIPPGIRPLLVFVNVKSGGCQGLVLLSSFRKLLNPYQVYDLENGGPLPGLYVFRRVKDYKILVCGGDGTVGWTLQCLDNVGQDSECSSPPCSILPLGTGNDLARVLRWGPGYTGGEEPLTVLKDIIDAEEIRLDRWTVVFHSDEKPDERPGIVSNSSGSTSEDNTAIFMMNNYFGIGIDADLCLDFHNAREENPNKFNSRLHNKGVYFKMGLRKMVGRKLWRDLNKEVRLEVDGKMVDLPPVEGIIILNILSWGSGANPWGPEREDQFSKPNHYDGMLEVVGVMGVVHMGQIQSGLRNAIRIAQGGHIRIRLNTDMPVQVDGEPWIQSPGEVVVLRSALKATMLRKSKMKRRNTESVLASSNAERSYED
ncbi:diacylglycerol kinase theta-like, partial [Limulus polyphemus]|uniref:Diacylglycerol kinase n=1 Tax=Limulus polyphemus TaxID=6850 RepID=A0ABM1SPV9_LIMPO